MSIQQQSIDEILARSDIVEVVSDVLPLKQAGRNFKALCPFHQEKTPSFTVNPDKQIFHCFGCSAGGNVISFLMKYHQLTFPEAIEALAKRYGITLQFDGSQKQQGGREEMFEALENVTMLFQDVFWRSAEADGARKYLKGRHLGEEILKTFRVGFCPANEIRIIKLMQEKKIRTDILEKLGVVISKGSSRYHLKFQGRIVFPICDAVGKVVGFGGRAMNDIGPKYLNSNDSSVFNKSRLFYGLHLAKNAAAQKKAMILTEGYIDVMRLYASGIENVVASLGTAFTEQQAGILKRYINNVVLSYDGDDAGMNAALRAMDIFLMHDMSVHVTRFPHNEDPDSYILRYGVKAFEDLIKKASPISEFRLDHLHKQFDVNKDKLAASREMIQWMSRFENPILRDEIFKKTAQRFRISEAALRMEYKRLQKEQPIQNRVRDQLHKRVVVEGTDKVEIEILRILLEDPQLKEKYTEQVKTLNFRNEIHRLYLEKVLDNIPLAKWNLPDIESFSSHLVRSSTLMHCEKALIDYITYLKQKDYEEEMANLQGSLRAVKDESKIHNILNKIQILKLGFQKEIALIKK